MYYSYDYSTIPHPDSYWLDNCDECLDVYDTRHVHECKVPWLEPNENLIAECNIAPEQREEEEV